MCSGHRRWQRSHQGTDLQENSGGPRESWWRFPEGATALGAARGVQDPVERTNWQQSEWLGWLCRGDRAQPLQKQGGSSELREMEPFIHKTNPKLKTVKQNKQKNHKTWENLGKTPVRKEQKGGKPHQGPDNNMSHKVSEEGVAPCQELLLPTFWSPQNDEELIPLYLIPLDWTPGIAWIKGSVICSKGSFPWCFPSPLFNPNEAKLCQGRNKIVSS